VDPRTLGENLHLLVGLLVVLVLGSLLGLGIWVGLRLWIGERRARRSWQEFQEQRHAPDDRPYPCYIDGICQECRRGDPRIYQADSGEELCPVCYDDFCRRAKQPKPPRPEDALSRGAPGRRLSHTGDQSTIARDARPARSMTLEERSRCWPEWSSYHFQHGSFSLLLACWCSQERPCGTV